jgi:hypothetical protein
MPIAIYRAKPCSRAIFVTDPSGLRAPEFRDGSAYQYANVPQRTYHELLRAGSKGAYFNHNIRSHFPYALLRASVRLDAHHNFAVQPGPQTPGIFKLALMGACPTICSQDPLQRALLNTRRSP